MQRSLLRKRRELTFLLQQECAVVLVGVLCSAWMLTLMPSRAAVDGEGVCISLRVIGVNGGDPGSAHCDGVAAAESSSSSSSSSSAAASSSASDTEPDTSGQSGARRHDIAVDRSRILGLIRQWIQRRRMHAAPSSSSSSSSRAALPFTDIEPQSWYEEAVRALMGRGLIDRAQKKLRPHEGATRAEMAKLIVAADGGTMHIPFEGTSFNDVQESQWFFPYVEEAAYQGWMIGYGNCYGSKPCFDRPTAIITRAEAAALAVRTLKLQPLNLSPSFPDVPSYAWYDDVLRIALDHCILTGGNEGRARPDDRITRAEMFVLFFRALSHLRYGDDCSIGEVSFAVSAHDHTALPPPHPAAATPDGAAAALPMGHMCLTGVVACLVEAVLYDTSSLGLFLRGALALPDFLFMTQTHPLESIGWLLTFLWLCIGLHVLVHIRHAFHLHRHSQRGA